MRVIGSIGIVLSILFVLGLVIAVGSDGGISVGEYAPVAYSFSVFALGLSMAAFICGKRLWTRQGAVLALAVLYLVSWSIAVNETSGIFIDDSIRLDQPHVLAGTLLAVSVFTLCCSIVRRPRSAGQAGVSDMNDSAGSTAGPAGKTGVGRAAKWMGWLTFLIGGGWWGLLFGDAIVHEPNRGFAELAMLTAGVTCVVLILPTIILTAHSHGSRKLWFNRLALALVSCMMTWTVVYSAIV